MPPTLVETLATFFAAEGFDARKLDGQAIFRLVFSTETAHLLCLAHARETEQQVLFYSLCPMRTADAQRAAVMELVTRINYGLVLGNFELDLSDGEVRFKTSLDLENIVDTEVRDELIGHLVYGNLAHMERYLPALLAVQSAARSPLDALGNIDDEDAPDLSKS